MTSPHNPQTQASSPTPQKSRRSILIWALVFLAIGLFGWYASTQAPRWKDRFVARKWRVVEPGKIYASGQVDRHLLAPLLQDNHIKEIICLLDDNTADPDVAAEVQLAANLGIARHNYPLAGDGTGDIRQYADAVAEMSAAVKAGRPVLVHCSSGAQRSNGATFYYRVLIQHQDADAAAAEMVRNSHSPRENPLLIPYLNTHMAEMAALLVQRQAIDQVPSPLPQIHNVPASSP